MHWVSACGSARLSRVSCRVDGACCCWLLVLRIERKPVPIRGMRCVIREAGSLVRWHAARRLFSDLDSDFVEIRFASRFRSNKRDPPMLALTTAAAFQAYLQPGAMPTRISESRVSSVRCAPRLVCACGTAARTCAHTRTRPKSLMLAPLTASRDRTHMASAWTIRGVARTAARPMALLPPRPLPRASRTVRVTRCASTSNIVLPHVLPTN